KNSQRNKLPARFPQIGTPAQFKEVKEFLAALDFTERSVCQKLGLQSHEKLDLIALSASLADRVAKSEPLNVAIRFFLLGRFVQGPEIKSQFSRSAWAALNSLGLVAMDEDSETNRRCACTVALYPVGELLIVSDRWSNPDHQPIQSFPDIVYPALTKSTSE